MRKILIIQFCIFAILSCKAQIIAVEDFEDFPNNLPDGAYIKDVNNVLGKFVGTWKGVYENKNYEFRISKFTQDNTKIVSLNYKEDLLLMRYKITDIKGVVIENTLNLTNENVYVIKGRYLAKTGSYVMNYMGIKGECGQNGTIYISVNGNIMNSFLSVNGEIYPECTTGEADQILPVNGIELTRQ